MSKYKWDTLKQASVDDIDGNFFDTIREKIMALIELRKHNPQYAQVALFQEMDDNEFIRKLRGDSTKRWKEIIERDKKRGIIKPEIDADVMIDMFYNFVLLNFYKVGLDEGKFMTRLDKAIKIIREGSSKEIYP